MVDLKAEAARIYALPPHRRDREVQGLPKEDQWVVRAHMRNLGVASLRRAIRFGQTNHPWAKRV